MTFVASLKITDIPFSIFPFFLQVQVNSPCGWKEKRSSRFARSVALLSTGERPSRRPESATGAERPSEKKSNL